MGRARTVLGAIRVAHRGGAISWDERVRFEHVLAEANGAARRLPAARAGEVRGVLVVARDIARAGRLNAERLVPVMKAVSATAHQMRFLPMPVAGQRLQTRGDGLVYEFRPGRGVQPHPLASAGRLNALALDCLDRKRPGRCDEDAVRQAASALVDLGVRDGRTLRLEYVFPFGSGRAPWSSAMAQATAAQALARAARVTGRSEDARGATRAYGALRRMGPRAMYSFSPMRVLNGELQTLVGLADYAKLSGNRFARREARATARSLLAELDRWDTGAWTLYSGGGREATLHYHRLAAGFARDACRRALTRAFCPAAKRYARYTREKPRVAVHVVRVTRAGRRVWVRVRASKGASGSFVVRGPRGVVVDRAVALGRDASVLSFVPRRAGRYRVLVSGVAVNGKRGARSVLVRVKPKPKPKPRRGGAKRARVAERR